MHFLHFPFRLTAVGILGSLAAASPLHADPFRESFDQVTDGQPLMALEGWSIQDGAGEGWALTATGGYEGGGIEVTTLGVYQRALPEENVATSGGRKPRFRAKVNIAASNDAYTYVLVDLRSTGGVNGLGIRFSGGKDPGSADNAIEMSEGGANWGDIQYRRVEAKWESGTWYEVEFSDITFDGDGVHAKVSVWPAKKPGSKLVENEKVTSYGSASSFQKINRIALGSKGADRKFLVDDLEFGTGKGE
jgi:hypothetical protein